MSNRKFNRFMTILINVFTFGMSLTSIVFATEGTGAVKDILTDILKVLLGLGGAICVAKLIHIGILYMTSSAVDKSNAKAAVFPWIVGTIVCFGAAWIGPAIIGMFKISGDVLDIQ